MDDTDRFLFLGVNGFALFPMSAEVEVTEGTRAYFFILTVNDLMPDKLTLELIVGRWADFFFLSRLEVHITSAGKRCKRSFLWSHSCISPGILHL